MVEKGVLAPETADAAPFDMDSVTQAMEEDENV
jgi:hypothetical protein